MFERILDESILNWFVTIFSYNFCRIAWLILPLTKFFSLFDNVILSIFKLSEINFSNIGIAVKDSSFVEINESKIFNSPICFAAYRKKQEFYGAKIKINKTNCTKDKFFSSEGSEINLGTWHLELKKKLELILVKFMI